MTMTRFVVMFDLFSVSRSHHVDDTSALLDKPAVTPGGCRLDEQMNVFGHQDKCIKLVLMTEEPIVNTPHDGIRAFLQGNLDYLAIGDFLVEHPTHKKSK